MAGYINRADYYENVRSDKTSKEVCNTLQASKEQRRASIKDKVNELIKRTGLADYVTQIQANLESNSKTAQATPQPIVNSPQSLLDIPFIKETLDKSLAKKIYVKYVDLLNDLKKAVVVDKQVPEHMKDVYGDKKLVDYVKKQFPETADGKKNYEMLGVKDNLDSEAKDPTSQSYFSFTSNDDKDK